MQYEKWFLRTGHPGNLSRVMEIDPLLSRILAGRFPALCFEDPHDIEIVNRFLDREGPLFDPFLLLDMKKAVDLIFEHLARGSRILILGDYDVDGVTSSAILYQGLLFLKSRRNSASDLQIRIPERMAEGYGIHESIVEEILEKQYDLVITCDNGTREVASTKALTLGGVDLIITDHHALLTDEEGGEVLPVCRAFINPHRAGNELAFPEICGAFVALQLIRALLLEGKIGEEERALLESDLFQLGALGTVCDVMPLTFENRKLVYQGLRSMNEKPLPSLRALALQKELKEFSVYSLGFVLGPMLNAGGRLGSQNKYMDLFTASDPSELMSLAKELSDLNEERQAMQQEGLLEGIRQIEETMRKAPVKVVFLPKLHESIAGLVAGKLREKFNHPVLVITRGEEGLKGSARSIEAYSMVDALTQDSECFTKMGGHPMAAGFSLKEHPEGEEAAVRELSTRLNTHCQLTKEDFLPLITIDAAISFSYWDASKIELLSTLGPFGNRNPEPSFAQKSVQICFMEKKGKKQNVLKLSLLTPEGTIVEAVSFHPEWADTYRAKDLVDLVYTPFLDTYYQTPRISFKILHIRYSQT